MDPSGTVGSALVPTALEGSAVVLASLVRRAQASVDGAVPPNTRAAYEGDLRRFVAWCTSVGLPAMPADPGTVALYMRHLADQGRRASTIERAVAAIATSHVQAGRPSPWDAPAVAAMRKALRRELGMRPRKVRALDDDLLRRLLGVLPASLLGVRDRSLLTLGWCAARRESELVAVQVGDITPAPKGLVLLVRRGKTDQQGQGHEVPVFRSNLTEHCPVESLDAWLKASGIVEGFVFRQLGRREQIGDPLSPEAVCARVKHWAKVAGLEPSDFGAHSLRSGFITTAARRGRDLDSIMVTTGHRSEHTARGYIQRETLFERGAGEGLL